MSQKELRAGVLITRVLARTVTTLHAAKQLSVSSRTIRRMKQKVRHGGVAALAHGLRGKIGNRRVPTKERVRLEKLLRERYHDFTPAFATEKLVELHGIVRDPKTIRRIMASLGLWQAKHRQVTVHRLWRERRSRYGELVQYDGSYEHWLEDRGGTGELCLLAAIDDATGQVLQAQFREHEGVLPTLGFWREYSQMHGLPQSIYLDKFSTYRMHMKTALENPDTKTQVGRVMQALGVELIFANSPQAKGRVERLFRTLQDRLIKELRLRKVDTIEKANLFLAQTFIPDFNHRFSMRARDQGNVHQQLTSHQRDHLDTTFCREDERTLLNDFTIPHGKIWYQLLPSPRLTLRPKDTVVIRTQPDGTVSLWVREKSVIFRLITKGKRTCSLSHQLSKRTFLNPSQADISISC